MNQRREDRAKHEDGVDDRLHALQRCLRLEERETNKQARHDRKRPLRHDIRRHAPVLLENTVGNQVQLEPKRHRKFLVTPSRMIILIDRLLVLLLLVDTLDLHFNSSSLIALLPDVEPVLALGVLTRVHDVEHVFCGVLVGFALPGTVGLEVIQESTAVVADFAKVDRLTAASEEEESIELLEEDSAGLVNCAEDCLTVVCQLPEERANSPGGLGVETTARC